MMNKDINNPDKEFIDPVTGVFNKRKMKIVYNEFSSKEQPIAMFMLDVDNFKDYNQIYGYDQGDSCLKKIALQLKEFISLSGSGGFLFYYNNDEFLILLPNTHKEEAIKFGLEVLDCVHSMKIPCENNLEIPFITVSVGGISFYKEPSMTVKDYIKYAEIALYNAKSSGKARSSYHDI